MLYLICSLSKSFRSEAISCDYIYDKCQELFYVQQQDNYNNKVMCETEPVTTLSTKTKTYSKETTTTVSLLTPIKRSRCMSYAKEPTSLGYTQ